METDVSMNSESAQSKWYSRDVSMHSYSRVRRSLGRSALGRPSQALSGINEESPARRTFRAPSGYSDSESDAESNGCTPSFSMQAPGTSSDEDDDSEVTSKPNRERAPGKMAGISPAQEELHSLKTKLDAQLLLSARRKTEEFYEKLRSIDQNEAAELQLIKARRQRRQAVESGADEDQRAKQSAGQRKMIAGLQEQHNQQAQLMDRQAEAAEQLAKQERERAEAEAAKKKAVEEAASRRQAEAAQALAEKEAQAIIAKQAAAKKAVEEKAKSEADEQIKADKAQKAEVERRQRSDPDKASTSGQTHGIRITQEAAKFEADCLEVLREYQKEAEGLKADKSQNAARREIFKKINKIVGQIGGTQEQVNVKSKELREVLSATTGAMQAFALVHLALGFIDLAERSDSAFAVALVAVEICNLYPPFLKILLARLHQACPLSVPKACVKLKQESMDDYLKRWGYRRAEQYDKKAKKMVEDWEEQEVYLRRLTSHVRFYAACLQADQQRLHGMGHAWSYLARLLNLGLPNRYTAFALTAFIEIAGHRLFMIFRSQAMKLFMFIWQSFLPELQEKSAEEASSAVRRLTAYLQEQRYLREPDGRKLEMFDASSHDRA